MFVSNRHRLELGHRHGDNAYQVGETIERPDGSPAGPEDIGNFISVLDHGLILPAGDPKAQPMAPKWIAEAEAPEAEAKPQEGKPTSDEKPKGARGRK